MSKSFRLERHAQPSNATTQQRNNTTTQQGNNATLLDPRTPVTLGSESCVVALLPRMGLDEVRTRQDAHDNATMQPRNNATFLDPRTPVSLGLERFRCCVVALLVS